MQTFRLFVCALLFVPFQFPERVLAQQAPSQAFLTKIEAAYSSQRDVPRLLSLTGSGSWTAGSLQESGLINETVSSDGSTRESWTFPTVSHSHTQGPIDLSSFGRVCSYADAKGKNRSIEGRNCIQPIPWFDPSFVSSKIYAPSALVTDMTSESDIAQGLVKLSYTFALSQTQGLPAASLKTLQQLQGYMTVNIFYNSQTALPSRMEYQQAIDRDDATSLDVAVSFGDYSSEGGFMVPHHIQRFLQRTMILDFVVTSVSVQ